LPAAWAWLVGFQGMRMGETAEARSIPAGEEPGMPSAGRLLAGRGLSYRLAG
jgi:hypothetical protein